MESTLKNMVLTLLIITAVSAALLGSVYGLTKEPIEAAKSAKTTGALSQVLPEFDNQPAQDTVTVVLDAIPVKVYTARKGNTPVGYAVETATRQGFSGLIKMMVGFKPDGEVVNIEVLEHNETPGLGSKMADPDNVLLVSFRGKNPANLNMNVTKDGGDIDVITASTISSRAYSDAVGRAFRAFQSVALGVEEEQVDYFAEVLPEYDRVDSENPFTNEVDGNQVKVYTAYLGEQVAGYAVETRTSEGYHGEIVLMVGLTPDGLINDIYVVAQDETAGFGKEIIEEGNPLAVSFIGNNIENMKMSFKREGGDVDALSGSTVTSTAYLNAMKYALIAYLNMKGGYSNE